MAEKRTILEFQDPSILLSLEYVTAKCASHFHA